MIRHCRHHGVARAHPLAAALTPAIVVMGGMPCLASALEAAAPGGAQFDIAQLQSSGYSPSVAAYFSNGARFSPGLQVVSASVNGRKGIPLQLEFDGQGEPCLDAVALARLGIRPAPPGAGSCIELGIVHPGGRVHLRPSQARVEVLVPEGALQAEQDGLQRGGAALMLNHDLFVVAQRSAHGMRTSGSARVELGLNAGGWALRAQASASTGVRQQALFQDATFAERAVERWDALLQVGQLAVASQAYGGLPFDGVQLIPDRAQVAGRRLAVPVSGVARSQAVAEVRQRGQVIYRTIVGPGPFLIDDVGEASGGSDLEVVVTEDDGTTRRYPVPAPLLSAQARQAEPAQTSLSVGRYRPSRGAPQRGPRPWMLVLEHASDLGPSGSVRVAGLLASAYQGVATQASLSLPHGGWLAASVRGSRHAVAGVGREVQLQGSLQLPAQFSAGLSLSHRDARFTAFEQAVGLDAGEPLVRRPDGAERAVGLFAGWASARWGAASYSVSRSCTQAACGGHQSLGWSRRLLGASFTVSAQRSSLQAGTSVWLNVTVPLGGRRGSAGFRAQRQGDGPLRLGASLQRAISDDVEVSADLTRSDGSRYVAGRLQARTAVGSVQLGCASGGSSPRCHAGISGGVVVLPGGRVATSTARIGTTFAVVDVPGVAGLRLQGAGYARTLVGGRAVLPRLSPYQNNRIRFDGRHLPLNLQLATTAFTVKPAHAAVVLRTVDARERRQLLLQVTLADGTPAPVGSVLHDPQGGFAGTTVSEGNVFLVDAQIGQSMSMEVNGQRCQLQYAVPPRFDPQRAYEEATARCN
ncbi:fimbria/pilus outer membrane usher protein [Stenotrophomonas sp. C3(2023)]|uniref:fimbria/pilus outer membrane usher protein n=1 Tax=Stenotrophomonas sp. C3(2023) TaxID=3080277 RepID=UPI00293CB7A0|nr:fimbria/pilus outer membrane usher protein [Stenotrophomonas sp. C3(2023)]MDV3467390.1 fimbria/pilus outer membrane usher protein [Stenotrophomonas sp. C3(2023)]